jgi:putative heme transporter
MATAARTRASIRLTRRGSWRFALSAVGLGLAGFELRGRLPGPAAVWTALAQSRPGWMLAAAALSALSMAAFASSNGNCWRSWGYGCPCRRRWR